MFVVWIVSRDCYERKNSHNHLTTLNITSAVPHYYIIKTKLLLKSNVRKFEVQVIDKLAEAEKICRIPTHLLRVVKRRDLKQEPFRGDYMFVGGWGRVFSTR